ncbi:MAG TPA: MoxR family ATPase [Aeromonadales bacterium]|nr:MoxR family ATPase [Aeromonadales bacterium]
MNEELNEVTEETVDEEITPCQRLMDEIQKAVIGQKQVIREVVIALIAGGHVLIEGVPGLGKTLLVKALSYAINCNFKRIQFTPDLMPSDITGYTLYDLKSEKFKIQKGPVFSNFLLADEINRAPAKTQAALLEVMQEQQVTIEGHTFELDSPYMVLATQNPIEQEGTYPLPEAQLDRFLLKIAINYPELEDESLLVKLVTNGQIGNEFNLSALSSVLTPEIVNELQKRCANILVDDKIMDYAVNLIRATRNWQGFQNGAGPRGAIALIRAARANALINNNNFVTPDDVKAVVLPVLRHRVMLSAEMEIEGMSSDQLLTQLIEQVEAPRQ